MFQTQNNQLHAQFHFADFSAAFAFMTEVALLAERMAHHPEWRNCYSTVEIWLTTHDAGNTITQLDQKMAAAIEVIYKKYKPTKRNE